MTITRAPDGYEIAIHRSLTETITLAGVPRTFAILNATFAAALVLGLQSWYILPVFILIHLGAVVLTKYDPQFFDAFKRLIKQKRYYGT